MGILRDQFTDFARELAADADRRRQFVVQNRNNIQRMRDRFSRERDQLRLAASHRAQKLIRDLTNHRRGIRRRVQATLSDYQSHRLRFATERLSQRQRFVAGVQRGVATALRQHRATLIHNQRRRALMSSQVMYRLRSRMQNLRLEDQRRRSMAPSFPRRAS